MDWQVVAPVLHFLTVSLFQVPLHHPINKATSQKWHPLNQFSIFCDSICVHQFHLLPTAKFPTAGQDASHGLSTLCSFPEELNPSRAAVLSPVLCLCLNIPLKTVHEKGLLHLPLPFLPYFALFLVLSYTGCFHHRWLFPTLLLPIWSGILQSFVFPLKTIALHLKTFMLLALTNIHQRFLDISCSSGIFSVAMVGSSPKKPIKAPVWKSVTWYGFY